MTRTLETPADGIASTQVTTHIVSQKRIGNVRKGMHVFAGMPTLCIRFDLTKAWTSAECWRTLWRVLRPREFPGVFLFDGPNVVDDMRPKPTFCIAMQSFSPTVLQRARLALLASPTFYQTSARPPFALGTDGYAALLDEVGRIDHQGRIVACASPDLAAVDSPD